MKTDSSNSGSTATIIAWDMDKRLLYIANTGDTRAVLCRRGFAVDLSKDRKASDPEEILRIYLNGGNISNNRVMGSLAITRAFGDRQLKTLNKSTAPAIGFNRDILTVEPEIAIADIYVDIDEFVVLATDGLWDVMSSQDVTSMIRQLLDEEQHRIDSMSTSFEHNREGWRYESISGSALDKIADHLVNHAINLGSLDNVTVMILCFNSTGNSSDSNDLSVASGAINHCHSIRRIIELYGRKNPRSPAASLGISSKVNSLADINTNSTAMVIIDTPSGESKSSISSKIKADEHVDEIMDFLLDDSNF